MLQSLRRLSDLCGAPNTEAFEIVGEPLPKAAKTGPTGVRRIDADRISEMIFEWTDPCLNGYHKMFIAS